MLVRRGQRLALMLVACLGLAVGGDTATGAAQGGSSTAHVAKKKAKKKHGSRGTRGPRGFAGPGGPQGAQGPPGPAGTNATGTPLVKAVPAGTANTIIFNRAGLRIELNCSAGKVTSLVGRSTADHGIIRVTNLVTRGELSSDNFNTTQTINLTPDGTTNNYTFAYVSYAQQALTATYSIANNGGGGAATNSLGDCVVFGQIVG